MSMLPFILWGAIVILGLVFYLLVAMRIEKSGLARLGATGHLFTCDPDPAKIAEEEKSLEEFLK